MSLRDGVLLDLAGAATANPADFAPHVLASAASLGARYRYDALHAGAVARLSTRLFDLLAAEHALGPRDRLLLEVAALLHDIGLFVSLRGHHKHSLYLLQASEIFGLSRDDMQIVGNIARYHRRGTAAEVASRVHAARSRRARAGDEAGGACSGWRTPSTPSTSRRSPTSACRSRTRAG